MSRHYITDLLIFAQFSIDVYRDVTVFDLPRIHQLLQEMLKLETVRNYNIKHASVIVGGRN